MGQGQSTGVPREQRSDEEIIHVLARRFADKCFTQLEIYALKDVFRQLADTESSVRYVSEDTVARFLEIPDALGASAVLFQMISFLGAFPFLRDAPAVIGLNQLVIVLVLATDRYKKVLARGAHDRNKLIYKSLAVYDRLLAKKEGDKKSMGKYNVVEAGVDRQSHAPGFAVDQPQNDDEEDEEGEEDDELVLAAFETLNIDEIVHKGDEMQKTATETGMIPADNFRHFIMLLLLVAPLGPQESLSQYVAQLPEDGLQSLRTVADSILASFLNVETSPGVKASQWNRVIPVCFPNIFTGLHALFEHFLFSKDMDMSKPRRSDTGSSRLSQPAGDLKPSVVVASNGAVVGTETFQPLLAVPGEIMVSSIVSQLSFFLPGSSLFRRLRPLYAGSNDGFSLGSFQTKVFNWRAPTILLVTGTRLTETAQSVQEANFAASISSRKFRPGSKGDRLTFGVYISTPWRHTHKECFGESDTVLFQLEPVHDVFPASKVNSDYVTFTKAPGTSQALAFGSPHPKPSQSSQWRNGQLNTLGAVSLRLDASLEFGVFHHDYTSKGGAFQNSVFRRFDFQDRFEVESLEVWGCGGDEEAKAQAERWAWEEREAEARRRVNLGTGDIEADRALLEMAGLVGANRSGGSMI
ncbi:Restriction of telomere capping protein 5 [Ceratocystis fimbriata CBS 114723]|uniref:Restriction of telomere capping protein 5 n=1 Tax=Ceratocystis fimbriata CBS 114723 TaxID=1035309 RepID=A0A2C5X3M5_9PEZI|nr:Restriction of telomere capping protein 5 [Ceratocystis fimbriata CBS 114723]